MLTVRAPLGWLGPGRLQEDIPVMIDDRRVTFAGPSRDAPSGSEDEFAFDGFVMPGVVDRHVHIGLSDPQAVVGGGVMAVRDLGWPPDVIFPLCEVSEDPSFHGPLIRAAGQMITCP
ncbi:MAG TPA: hypothetical protein VHH54_01000, partial [Actinomycetota bacterium]|nr:hypothetical protein [Actinomycetota bacterium]